MVCQVVVVIVVEICHFFLFMAPSTIIYLPFLHSYSRMPMLCQHNNNNNISHSSTGSDRVVPSMVPVVYMFLGRQIQILSISHSSKQVGIIWVYSRDSGNGSTSNGVLWCRFHSSNHPSMLGLGSGFFVKVKA